MKIGILTYHAAHNYGAMLQAYALQKFLQNNHKDTVKIVDYRPSADKDASRILQKPTSFKQLVLFIIQLVYYRQLKKKYHSFQEFFDVYLDKTKRFFSFNQLKEESAEFDMYITGSDQTFSPRSKFVDVFYLDFCQDNQIRAAYAPSFGFNHIPDDKVDKIKELLMKYKFLSVRETGGCNLVENLTGVKVPSVLDPVYLLQPEEWSSIARPVRLKFSSFILCYALIGTKKQMDIANKIKEMTGLPVVIITHSVWPRTNADITVNHAGPLEFLWLFKNAKYVVTDSFHGTAFSLLFKKSFFIYIAYKEKSERIISLLTKVGLLNRIIALPKEVTKENLVMDFSEPMAMLQEERNKSIHYLKNCLNG